MRKRIARGYSCDWSSLPLELRCTCQCYHEQVAATQAVNSSPMTEEQIKRFLDDREAQLHQIRVAHGKLQFAQYESKRPQPGMAELEAKQAALQRDPALAAACMQWQGRAADPLLARRVELWSQSIRRAQVDGDADILRLRRELANDLVAARYDIGGREVELGIVRDTLRKSVV